MRDNNIGSSGKINQLTYNYYSKKSEEIFILTSCTYSFKLCQPISSYLDYANKFMPQIVEVRMCYHLLLVKMFADTDANADTHIVHHKRPSEFGKELTLVQASQLHWQWKKQKMTVYAE